MLLTKIFSNKQKHSVILYVSFNFLKILIDEAYTYKNEHLYHKGIFITTNGDVIDFFRLMM